MSHPKPSAPRPRKKWRPDADTEAVISTHHGGSDVLEEREPGGFAGRAAGIRPQAEQPKRRFVRRTTALPSPPAVIAADAREQAAELLRPTPVRWGWVLLPAFLVAAAASWFALPIREVTVQGQRHLSAQQVVNAAGISTDFGWLYYGARRAAGLANEPWVASATVTRQFPDRVSIAVAERTPYAVWQRPAEYGGNIAVARDGTPLPDALAGGAGTDLPAVEGWGPNRVRDALAVLEALRPYNVQLVKFTPSGFTVYPAEGGAAWSGDLDSLLKHANAISEYPNEQLYIYPWGVSVQQ